MVTSPITTPHPWDGSQLPYPLILLSIPVRIYIYCPHWGVTSYSKIITLKDQQRSRQKGKRVLFLAFEKETLHLNFVVNLLNYVVGPAPNEYTS